MNKYPFFSNWGVREGGEKWSFIQSYYVQIIKIKYVTYISIIIISTKLLLI